MDTEHGWFVVGRSVRPGIQPKLMTRFTRDYQHWAMALITSDFSVSTVLYYPNSLCHCGWRRTTEYNDCEALGSDWMDGDHHGIISRQSRCDRSSYLFDFAAPAFPYSPILLFISHQPAFSFSLFSTAGRRCFKSGDSTGSTKGFPAACLLPFFRQVLTFSY